MEFPYALILARKGKTGNLMTYCIGKLCTVSTKGFYENLKVYEIVQAKAMSIENNDLDGQEFLFK